MRCKTCVTATRWQLVVPRAGNICGPAASRSPRCKACSQAGKHRRRCGLSLGSVTKHSRLVADKLVATKKRHPDTTQERCAIHSSGGYPTMTMKLIRPQRRLPVDGVGNRPAKLGPVFRFPESLRANDGQSHHHQAASTEAWPW